jgi:TetR/AcrR family transcriptional repressor of nem operon
MAGFATEVPHLSEKAQTYYTEALEQTFDKMAEMFMEKDSKLTLRRARSRAISLFSHMVGTVLLSRAVSAKNPPLADEILEHSRSGMLAELEKSPKPRAVSKRQRTGAA